MNRRQHFLTVFLLITAFASLTVADIIQKNQKLWKIHDTDRPQPTVVSPAELPAGPPSDAYVLFDGKDLNLWLNSKNKPAQWKIENGYMEVNGTGSIQTKQSFGDCQLHIEWATPEKVSGNGQERGNSGVFFMNRYELQILDSYQNKTYPDGQAASIYGQYPPLVNACRGPGKWQSYDAIFRRPVFGQNGKVIQPARITVLHNGVLVQDNVEFLGTTAHKKSATYSPHEDKLPISLQDHGNPTRFRNIWIRKLQ